MFLQMRNPPLNEEDSAANACWIASMFVEAPKIELGAEEGPEC
jgi:hypothetical protein